MYSDGTCHIVGPIEARSSKTTTPESESTVKITPSFSREMPPPLSSTSKMSTMTSRLMVRDFHDVFICYLCRGYKIEATAINECMHSYCRTCIVKYLEVRHYCPECFHKKFVVNSDGSGSMIRIGVANINGGQPPAVNSPRIITYQNLHPDVALMALIYKLVPGLYKREMNDVQSFYCQQPDLLLAKSLNGAIGNSFERLLLKNTDCLYGIASRDAIFVSSDEPISLSLEYHPKELEHVRNITSENIPKTKYLQCPAGVRICHLQKFLCSKFSLSPQEYRVDVLYGDEIMQMEFNLMDIIYSFNWKRDAPMRFFYRILEISHRRYRSLRVPMGISDNDSFKKSEAVHTTVSLAAVTLQHVRDLQPTDGGNKNSFENNLKLSSVVDSSGSFKFINPTAVVQKKCESQIDKTENLKKSHSKESHVQEKIGSKRKLKDEFQYVEQFHTTSSSQSSSPPLSIVVKQPSSKSVTFNETVLAARIPIIKRVNIRTDTCSTASSNASGLKVSSNTKDYKRLRSNDVVSNLATKSAHKLPQVTSSSSSTLTVPATTTNAPSAGNDSSRITSGTVPVHSSTQFHSNKTIKPSSAQLVVTTSSAQQVKDNTLLQPQNKTSEKFAPLGTSLQVPARSEKSTADNRPQNTAKKCNNASSQPDDQRIIEQHSRSGDPKNDYNGNVKHEKNNNVAKTVGERTAPTTTMGLENTNERQWDREKEEDKYEYVKNIGLKPVHEVKLPSDKNIRTGDKNKDVDERRAELTDAMEDSLTASSKKRKKCKHSKDFPFADSKRKKVDYDLAISATNVPKNIIDKPGNRSPDSLKMKFVKVVSDKKNSEVITISRPGDNNTISANNRFPSQTASSAKLDISHRAQSVANKSTKLSQHGESTNLTEFPMRSNCKEIQPVELHKIPQHAKSPPALGIATPCKGNKVQQVPSKSASGNPSLTKSSSSHCIVAPPPPPPPVMKSRISVPPTAHLGDGTSHNNARGSSTPHPQRSYSYDPSTSLGSNYLTPLQFQMLSATENMFQKWAAGQVSQKKNSSTGPVKLPGSGSVKKPVPPLVPPSSLGMVNVMPKLVAASSPGSLVTKMREKPPMVEIVRLPPDLDKWGISHMPIKAPFKANRPPPPTIPLVKIRRASANSSTPIESTEDASASTVVNTNDKHTSILGLPEKVENYSIAKGTIGSQKPLPKLNEISKISRVNDSNSSLFRRQQSASVRSVPNPSALALRNLDQDKNEPKNSNVGERLNATMEPLRRSPPAMASFASPLEKLAHKMKEVVPNRNTSFAN